MANLGLTTTNSNRGKGENPSSNMAKIMSFEEANQQIQLYKPQHENEVSARMPIHSQGLV